MTKNEYRFSYEVYDSIDELSGDDALLLKEAQKATQNAYAPYSQFRVGAVARMANGQLVTGFNQENASFPVGICAERVLLSAAASLFPNQPIQSIAISYQSNNGGSDHPITPCGICRQSLQEYEMRTGQSIRLILGGMEGKIYVIGSAGSLLPLGFTSDELK
jgi:Cytidine deaminase